MPAERRLAWDCGTGSGQAATMLVPHFRRVIGTDASLRQLRAADPAPHLHYFVCLAESAAIASRSVDLVTVAQALHWLDRPRFFVEVQRVARPGAALAVFGYNRLETTPEVSRLIREFHEVTVGPYWPPERKLVDQRYKEIEIPLEEVEPPPLTIEADLRLPALLGYLSTWSAVARYREALGHDPLERLAPELERVWGDPNRPRRVRWPLFVRAGRVKGKK